jgi:hypothetical protein
MRFRGTTRIDIKSETRQMDEKQNRFEGWAVIELFGHSREAGYVTTEYFGTGALLRVDVPELPERDIELSRPEWIDGQMAGAGSKIRRSAVPGRTRFVGPAAIYAMNPCSKDAAFKVIESLSPREIKIIELVGRAPELSPGAEGEQEDYPSELEEETTG